ncbi:hypothetical protein FXO37_18594 [Capsicum annuum]|nr:hypothetical protein FXO37_18594 [Capsicum annuum]
MSRESFGTFQRGLGRASMAKTVRALFASFTLIALKKPSPFPKNNFKLHSQENQEFKLPVQETFKNSVFKVGPRLAQIGACMLDDTSNSLGTVFSIFSVQQKTYSHWASYIKIDVFDDLMLRWKKDHFESIKSSPNYFGICCKLRRRITEMICSSLDFKASNKLMSKYYPGIEKVKRRDFYTDFDVTENFFKEDDLYEIGMVYFIIRFLVPDLPRNYIPKLYFDLVEFVVAIRSESVMSPRILNWRSSEDLIFNEYLKTTMFKRYSNEVRAEMLKFQEKVLDGMSNNKKKVDKQFAEVKQYVVEFVKTILNELRSAGIKSDEFNEDRKNDSRSVDDLLQTPHESKTCEEIPNKPINVKDELSRDMTFEMDVNVSESFHWIMILFRIRYRCLYVYDSFIGGALNTKNVHRHVQSLATIIPLFLFATDFYGKQADICWDREPTYIDKSMPDPLKYVIVRNIPQQAPQSNDCGMYACAFTKVLSHGLFDISTNMFNATNHRMRYGAIL